MRLYIAYASEDSTLAEEIYVALIGDGHQVFLDRPSLNPGDDFDLRFREAIASSDAMIFLISRNSIQQGCYALTELEYARQRWPHPGGYLIPVRVEPIDIGTLPPYLRSVTILEPRGNVAAEVAHTVRSRQATRANQESTEATASPLRIVAAFSVASILAAVAIGVVFSYAYPRVEITRSLVVLFLLVAVAFMFVVLKFWKVLK